MQWWKYLFMELRERRKKKFDWTQYKKWKAAYRDYFIFSLKQYKVEWSNGFELNENVEQAKCLLSLADVAECRKRARFTAQTYTDGNALPSWIDSPNFFNEEIPRGRFMASDVPFDILLVLSWPSFRLEVGHDFHLEISNFSLALSDKDKILVVDAGISKVSLVASSNELLCLQHPVENGISLQCDFNKGNSALSTNLRVRHTKLVYNTTIHTFVIDKLAHYLQLDLFDFQSNPTPKKAVSSGKPAVSLFPENKFRVRVDGITAVVNELTLNVERISVTHELR
ncbi:hypothetical protein AGDE_14482 [Angomonas deanei]|nr:hypothetical protein AGDE_14482 [Angomonas deanei]|eukprot:EPY20728.1 hypothetical protein AGDE_14482 [Angomonas deanei]